MKQTKITFLGCGNMGRSLIGGLISNGYPADLLCGVDPDKAQREQASDLFNITVTDNGIDAVSGAGIVVLAVKPQAIPAVIKGVAETLKKERPLILSIAAGIRLSTICNSAGEDLPVVRVMPNTPALIGAGAAALFANPQVNDEQREQAESIMRSVGIALWLDHESGLDAVTALSGSGPAYFFLVMEAMEQAAIKLGLDEGQARLLTLETAFGASKMALESNLDPAVLRHQVTSPGGTTEKALEVLLEGNLTGLFERALEAASERSEELAREFEGD